MTRQPPRSDKSAWAPQESRRFQPTRQPPHPPNAPSLTQGVCPAVPGNTLDTTYSQLARLSGEWLSGTGPAAMGQAEGNRGVDLVRTSEQQAAERSGMDGMYLKSICFSNRYSEENVTFHHGCKVLTLVWQMALEPLVWIVATGIPGTWYRPFACPPGADSTTSWASVLSPRMRATCAAGILVGIRGSRHMADVEALHTYAGTETIQALTTGGREVLLGLVVLLARRLLNKRDGGRAERHLWRLAACSSQHLGATRGRAASMMLGV